MGQLAYGVWVDGETIYKRFLEPDSGKGFVEAIKKFVLLNPTDILFLKTSRLTELPYLDDDGDPSEEWDIAFDEVGDILRNNGQYIGVWSTYFNLYHPDFPDLVDADYVYGEGLYLVFNHEDCWEKKLSEKGRAFEALLGDGHCKESEGSLGKVTYDCDVCDHQGTV
jgi:hypothetical protein